MYYVSVLIPMVVFTQKVDVISQISKQFKIPPSSIQFFEVGSTIQRTQYVVKIPSLNLNLSQINNLIETNTKLRQQIHQLKQDIIKIQESVNFQRTFEHQRQLRLSKRQRERLEGLVNQYASNMSFIKNQAQTTIENLINSFKIEQINSSVQTQH